MQWNLRVQAIGIDPENLAFMRVLRDGRVVVAEGVHPSAADGLEQAPALEVVQPDAFSARDGHQGLRCAFGRMQVHLRARRATPPPGCGGASPRVGPWPGREQASAGVRAERERRSGLMIAGDVKTPWPLAG